MDPLTIMLLSAAIPAALNLGKSAIQGYQAKKLSKSGRPEYEIPEATTGALNSAKYQASQTQLPGMNKMQEALDTNTSRGIASLQDVSTSGAGLSSNIASLYRGNVAGQNQLGIAGATNWNNNQGILRAALSNYGGYQDKKFDINTMQPYLAKKGAESALREGSFRNLAAAGTDIARAGAGYAMLQNGQSGEEDTTTAEEDMSMTGGVKGTTGFPDAPKFSTPMSSSSETYNTPASADLLNRYNASLPKPTFTNLPTTPSSNSGITPEMAQQLMKLLQNNPSLLGYNAQYSR